VTAWNPQLMRLRQQLARIALTPDTLQERAEAALAVLGQVLPCDAAWLAVRDPEQGRHAPLATTGHAEPPHSYFQTPEADAELGINRHRPPMPACEVPVP
jgi:hypothetical protein